LRPRPTFGAASPAPAGVDQHATTAGASTNQTRRVRQDRRGVAACDGGLQPRLRTVRCRNDRGGGQVPRRSQPELPGQPGWSRRCTVDRCAAQGVSREEETVTTYIGLLRAINLPARNVVPMAVLRDMLLRLGLTEPRSLLQSGNVLFQSRPRTAAQLEKTLE